MKATKLLLFAIGLFICVSAYSQSHSLITSLDPIVSETSGLAFVNGKLWTHNDSGNDPILYCIDTTTGLISSQKVVRNAVNTDWEDICTDNEFLYIGDFGNNNGTRLDLKILKISLDDINDEFTDTVDAELIFFAYDESYYPETKKANNTDFDCEAMIATSDSIYLFSKNWISKNCYLYSLPKEAGNFTAHRRDTLSTQGLICGADYNAETNSVCLIGYVYGIPAPSILFILNDFESDNFFDGNTIRYELNLSGYQTEGIVFRDNHRLWFSNENFLGHTQSLYEFPISCNLSQTDNFKLIELYPNPAENFLILKLNYTDKLKFRIIDTCGNIVLGSCKKINPDEELRIDISNLKSGDYIIEFYSNKKSISQNFVKL
jgi:hypothetical protein